MQDCGAWLKADNRHRQQFRPQVITILVDFGFQHQPTLLVQRCNRHLKDTIRVRSLCPLELVTIHRLQVLLSPSHGKAKDITHNLNLVLLTIRTHIHPKPSHLNATSATRQLSSWFCLTASMSRRTLLKMSLLEAILATRPLSNSLPLTTLIPTLQASMMKRMP